MKALRKWETETNIYKMVRNEPFGYRIDKYTKDGKFIDCAIGATEYSLVYWFEHKDFRLYDEHKDF